jgi:DNA-binding transcriptional LysR family regulator
MHIVQSGLSASIKELELGHGWLSARRAGCRPDQDGQVIPGTCARATLTVLESGVTAVSSQDGVVRGGLHLGILQSLGPYLDLPLLLKRFRGAYPAAEITVRALNTCSIPALVGSGDVGLSFHALVSKTNGRGAGHSLGAGFAGGNLFRISLFAAGKEHPPGGVCPGDPLLTLHRSGLFGGWWIRCSRNIT